MSMQTDVQSSHVEATGTMVSGRVRVKGYQCLSGGTAGDIILRDGGASALFVWNLMFPPIQIIHLPISFPAKVFCLQPMST